MSSEFAGVGFDQGLLSPLTVTTDGEMSDAALLSALVDAEKALLTAWVTVGVAPPSAAQSLIAALDEGPEISIESIAVKSREGGNPVIPLVAALRERVPTDDRGWIHCGATSQDILDTASMMVARRAGLQMVSDLESIELCVADLAVRYRDVPVAGRTLTQHAVPTTLGLRLANWLHGIVRARRRLAVAVEDTPAQLGGAAGTLAAFVEVGGEEAAGLLPSVFAEIVGLATPVAPWHTARYPVTELADAMAQTIDALGKMASDILVLSRTEIGEVAGDGGGGSSTMPQKQNPVLAVLLRSAALRAPHLLASLHASSGLSVDERPDGAWHAEWPVMRQLISLTRGAADAGVTLVQGLHFDIDASTRNLFLTDHSLLLERINIRLTSALGRERAAAVVRLAMESGDLPEALRAENVADDALADLLDPSRYTGLAAALVDGLVAFAQAEDKRPQ